VVCDAARTALSELTCEPLAESVGDIVGISEEGRGVVELEAEGAKEVGTPDDGGTRLGELQSQLQAEGAMEVGMADDGSARLGESEGEGATEVGTPDDASAMVDELEGEGAMEVGTPYDGSASAMAGELEAEGATEVGTLDDGSARLGELEAEGAMEVGTPDEAALPPPPTPMAVHPGTRSAGLAGPGPSVTATQPGRYGSTCPTDTASWGYGSGAEHAFISASV